jgi:hypothetical protein
MFNGHHGPSLRDANVPVKWYWHTRPPRSKLTRRECTSEVVQTHQQVNIIILNIAYIDHSSYNLLYDTKWNVKKMLYGRDDVAKKWRKLTSRFLLSTHKYIIRIVYRLWCISRKDICHAWMRWQKFWSVNIKGMGYLQDLGVDRNGYIVIFRETVYEFDLSCLAQNRAWWWYFVNTLMNLRIP